MIVNLPYLMSYLLMFCGCLPWVSLLCVIVLFPDYTHLFLEAMTKKTIDSIALHYLEHIAPV